MILGLVEEAVEAGARLSRACAIVGVDARTLQRWREKDIGQDGRAGPKHSPRNKFTATERKRVLSVVNAPENRDLSPKQIVPRLANEGQYIGSESSVYRIPREEGQVKHREPSRPPTKRHQPTEHFATGPNQVWTWDITYLRSPIRGVFFYPYVIVDVWSRKIAGWTIEAEKSAEHAEAMSAAACARENVRTERLVIHSDNGAAMKALTLLAFFHVLGILPSYSRPAVSNDNPYSGPLFRTIKYRPQYPRRPFASIEQARQWMAWFAKWYNGEHLHSAIRFVTPNQRHAGEDVAILARRKIVYEAAKRRRPDRWTGRTRNWDRVETVVLNPNRTISQLPAEMA